MAKMNFEQQMQTLNHEFRAAFYKEQKEEWDKTPFTSDAINEVFDRYREFGMMYETPVGLNISPAYLTRLMFEKMESYFVSDIVTLCQAFENRTYFEYAMLTGGFQPTTPQGFANFLSMAEQITNEINAIVEPIKDRLVRKYQAMQNLQVNAGNRKIALS